MSNEFEFNGKVTAVIGRGSTAYRQLVDEMETSATIQVMTFNLDEPTLQLLAKAPKSAQRTLICNIPNRFERYFTDDARAKARRQITQYTQLLRQHLDGWQVYVCATNHAKVFRCDDVAYVGSANLTASHAANFEAGFVVSGGQVEPMINALIAEVLASSDCIPFFGCGSNHLLDAALALDASLDELAHRISCRDDFDEDIEAWGGPPPERQYLTSDDLSEIAAAMDSLEAEWTGDSPEFTHFANAAGLVEYIRHLSSKIQAGERTLVPPRLDDLIRDAAQEYIEYGDKPDDTECINAAAQAAASERLDDWESTAEDVLIELQTVIAEMREKCMATLRSFQTGKGVDNT